MSKWKLANKKGDQDDMDAIYNRLSIKKENELDKWESFELNIIRYNSNNGKDVDLKLTVWKDVTIEDIKVLVCCEAKHNDCALIHL